MLLVAALPSVLRGVEPDSTQFGFFSRERQDGARRTWSDPEDDDAEEDALDAGKGLESRGWDALPEWLHLELIVQSLYDDNIFLTAHNPEGDWINRVSPALRVSSGSADSARWVVSGIYDPVWTTYVSSSGQNSFDHALAATVDYNGRRLKGSSTFSYREATGNDRYVRGIFTTTTTQADLWFGYELTGKTSLEARVLWQDLERERSAALSLNNEETLSLQVSALWQATGKTRLGPAVRVGTTSSSLSPDRNFVDILLRADHESTGKLSFSGEAGIQRISYDGHPGDQWVPAVSLTARYVMNPSWQFVLNGYSRTTASPNLAYSDLQATGVNGFITLKPGSRFELSAGGGYESARSDFLNGGPDRTLDYVFGELRLAMHNENSPLSFEIFYRHRLNDSSEPLENFHNNQAGIRLGLRY